MAMLFDSVLIGCEMWIETGDVAVIISRRGIELARIDVSNWTLISGYVGALRALMDCHGWHLQEVWKELQEHGGVRL